MIFINKKKQLTEQYKLGLILIMLLFLSGISFADNQVEPMGIYGIKSVPSFDAKEINFSKAGDKKFNFKGTLDAIYENRIVVSDSSFPLQSNVQVIGIRIGKYVGLQFNEKGEVKLVMQLQPPE